MPTVREIFTAFRSFVLVVYVLYDDVGGALSLLRTEHFEIERVSYYSLSGKQDCYLEYNIQSCILSLA